MRTKHFCMLFAVIVIIASFTSFNAYGQQSVGLIGFDKAKAFKGYTLFAPLFSKTTYLIDMDGNLVHSWQSDYKPGNSVYLLENGNLLRTGKTSHETTGESGFFAGGYGGIIQEIDWDGNVVWEYVYSNPEHRQHHDIERLPNGNTLLIAWEFKTNEEARAAGRDLSILLQDTFWADTIIEVNSDKEIVWEWHAWDHICSEQGGVANGKTVSTDITDPGKININFINLSRTYNWQNPTFFSDWLHVNAIDYNEALDQILISSPHLDEFYVIDHSTCNYDNPAAGIEEAAGPAGDIIYRWGNPQVYSAGNAQDQKLFFAHDIHWIEPGLPGEGNFLCHNNGFGRSDGEYSSVIEFISPVESNGDYVLTPGAAYGPEEVIWDYKINLYSRIISGAQRLPNGNTLICSGANGHFFEVTPQEEIVWEYVNPVDFNGIQNSADILDRNYVFRCYRYPPDFPGLAGKDLTPDKPIEQIDVHVAKDELPFEFYLFQNYPNPFNMSTSIEFTIPSYGFSSLIIYNIMGQKIRELVAENLFQGKYTVVWNGKDDIGNTVSAGIYITRLKNNDYIMANRMLFLK